MELDCTMYDNLYFDRVDTIGDIKCYIKHKDDCLTSVTFHENGCYNTIPNAKCVIFPKGKTTWEGFQRPFKDGDIIHVCDEYSDVTFNYLAILKQIEKGGKVYSHCFYNYEDGEFSTHDYLYNDYNIRFATEEEKQKLFQAIRANGYKWNFETKTLEKLIVPKFKVGDKVRVKNGVSEHRIIDGVFDTFYSLQMIGKIDFTDQDRWELVPNKFDITTLKPFDKVLVRTKRFTPVWTIDFYDGYQPNVGGSFTPFGVTSGKYFQQCIPYEGNEHLRGTTNDCDEYFKTWK